MPNQFKRPQIPYNPLAVLPNSNRYELTAAQNQPINSDQLDGDFNYLLDAINTTYDFAAGIGAGILPGATSPTNVNKFPITDGESPATITWTKVTADYIAANAVGTNALADGNVTSEKLADASITNEKIEEGAIQDNNITDNSISFSKITIANNVHFQQFFNEQGDGTLDGKKIQSGTLPANTLADNSLSGVKITTNTLPAVKIVDASITNQQLSAVVQIPVGTVFDYAAPGSVPSGYVEANGQLLNRITYALLFAKFGTLYGAGDGATTFGTPDARGRVMAGIDPASGQPTGARIVNGTIALGATGGAETHTLTVPEMPSHHHTYTKASAAADLTASGSAFSRLAVSSDSTGSTGGDSPHNNMQPYMLQRKIIYAGV